MVPGSLKYILKTVSEDLAAVGVCPLLIGGFAVNHYGYSRHTMDVDFMIDESTADTVRRVMMDAGFTNRSEMESVDFYRHPEGGMRVDFLKVNASTFEKLCNECEKTILEGYYVPVPNLQSILAMKLFAMSSGSDRRGRKDLLDVIELSVINDVDLQTLKILCREFASETLYENLAEEIMKIRGNHP